MAPTPKPPPAPPAPAGVKGIGGFLTAKKGPLPVWAWVLLGTVGLYLGYKWYENRAAASSATTSPSDTEPTSAADTGDSSGTAGDGSGDSGAGSQPGQLPGDMGGGGSAILDALNAETQAIEALNGSLSASGSKSMSGGAGAPAKTATALPTGSTLISTLSSGAKIYVGPGGKSLIEQAPGKGAYPIGPATADAVEAVRTEASEVPAPGKAATVKAKASTSKAASSQAKRALK